MINFIKDKGLEHKVMAGQYVLQSCPYCGDNTFHFYVDPEKEVFFCHKCNQKGNKFQFRRQMGDVSQDMIRSMGQVTKGKIATKKPPMTLVDKNHTALLGDAEAMTYLSSRGIDVDTAKHFKLGLENIDGLRWLGIPYFLNGECVNIKYRSIPPAEKSFRRTKDGMSSLFNQDCLQGCSEVVITEGELDAISVWQSGIKNVVSIANGCSSFLPEWFDAIDPIEKIYLWYDNDEKGKKAAREIADRFGIDRCYVVRVDGIKDANEYFQKNKVMDLQTIGERYDVENVSLFVDAAHSLFAQGDRGTSDISFPWRKINDLVGRIEEGDLITVSGTPKTGKTTWALQIATYNALCGYPALFYCLEMRPERLARKVIQCEAQITQNEVTLDRVKGILGKLVSTPLYFAYNYKTINLEGVLAIIRQAVRRYGIKMLVFDNLHYLSRSITNVTQEVGLISRSFKMLAEELRIPIFLIAQPRKVQDGQVMSMNDLKDSSSIGADSDQVIVLFREKIQSKAGEDASASYRPETLVRVDASRWSPGGDRQLFYKGEHSRFGEMEG